MRCGLTMDGSEGNMKLFTSIDEKIERKGYRKTEENRYCTIYEKTEPQGYVHTVGIMRKESGQHLFFSYTDINKVVGLPYDELLLFCYKFFLLRLKWK